MTDKELKIQLALGSIKWWKLTFEQISKIKDIELIHNLHAMSHVCATTRSVEEIYDVNIVDMVKVYLAITQQYGKITTKKQPGAKKSAQQ